MSKEFDYQEKVLIFNHQLDSKKNTLCTNTSDYRRVCEVLKNIDSVPFVGEKASIRDVKNLFLGSIETLGKDTIHFYREELPKVRIKKKKNFPGQVHIEKGSAGIFELGKKYVLFTHKKDHITNDLVAINHEFGHIPVMKNTANGDFYDYDEVLPIFFEYLSYKSIYGDVGKYLFVQDRMNISKYEAEVFLSFAARKNCDQSIRDRYLSNCMRRSFKYIKSFEYVLQLLDRDEEDHELVSNAIDKIVDGESTFKDQEKYLDIDTHGCKKILSKI